MLFTLYLCNLFYNEHEVPFYCTFHIATAILWVYKISTTLFRVKEFSVTVPVTVKSLRFNWVLYSFCRSDCTTIIREIAVAITIVHWERTFRCHNQLTYVRGEGPVVTVIHLLLVVLTIKAGVCNRAVSTIVIHVHAVELMTGRVAVKHS